MLMPAASNTMGDFIPYNHCCQHRFAVGSHPLSYGQRRWENLSPWMPTRVARPIIAIQTICCAGVSKGRSGSACAPVVQKDRRFISLPRLTSVGSSDIADGS